MAQGEKKMDPLPFVGMPPPVPLALTPSPRAVSLPRVSPAPRSPSLRSLPQALEYARRDQPWPAKVCPRCAARNKTAHASQYPHSSSNPAGELRESQPISPARAFFAIACVLVPSRKSKDRLPSSASSSSGGFSASSSASCSSSRFRCESHRPRCALRPISRSFALNLLLMAAGAD